MMPRTLLFFSLLSIAACAAPPTSDLVIRADPTAGGDGPCGWIYVFDRPDDARDACVYVWSPTSWSLAEATRPGLYDAELSRGEIQDGFATGFPADVLREARIVYVAGHLTATLDGEPIPRHDR